MNQNTFNLHSWNPTSRPPTKEGEYIVMTNYEDVFIVKFKDGQWESPERYNAGEYPEFWTTLPTTYVPSAELFGPRLATHSGIDKNQISWLSVIEDPPDNPDGSLKDFLAQVDMNATVSFLKANPKGKEAILHQLGIILRDLEICSGISEE